MAKASSISVPEGIKSALAGIKAEMSKARKVTWGEVMDILLQHYSADAGLEAEVKRLGGLLADIAVNQSKAAPMVITQQVALQSNPPAPKLVPPRKSVSLSAGASTAREFSAALVGTSQGGGEENVKASAIAAYAQSGQQPAVPVIPPLPPVFKPLTAEQLGKMAANPAGGNAP